MTQLEKKTKKNNMRLLQIKFNSLWNSDKKDKRPTEKISQKEQNPRKKLTRYKKWFWKNMELLIMLLIASAAGLIGIAVGWFLRFIVSLGKKGSMEIQIKEIHLEARTKSER